MAMKKGAKDIRTRYEADSFTVEASQKDLGPFEGWLLLTTYPIRSKGNEIMKQHRSVHGTKKNALKAARKARHEHPTGAFAVMPNYSSDIGYNVGDGP